MMKRIGIVGLGLFAQDFHLPSLQILERRRNDFSITALADLNPERRKAGGKRWPEACLYTSAEKLLQAEPLDGVFLFTSPDATAAVGTRFLESGIPCLLEKPPGLTMAENRQLAAATRRGNTFAFAAFNRRYAPVTELARRLIAEFSGPIEQIRCDFRRIDRVNEDFSTTAIHGLDTVSFLAEAPLIEMEITRQPIGRENVRIRAVHANGIRSCLQFLPDSDVQTELYTVVTQEEQLELHFPCGSGAGKARLSRKNGIQEFSPPKTLEEEKIFRGGYFAEDNRFLAALSDPRQGQLLLEEFETTAASVGAAEAIRTGLTHWIFPSPAAESALGCVAVQS